MIGHGTRTRFERGDLEASIDVPCSQTAAIVWAHRYFDERHSIVSIGIPLHKLGLPTSVHVYRNVIVYFDVVPDRSASPKQSAIQLSWKPTHGGAFPALTGTITSRANVSNATLYFNGRYRPPFGVAGMLFDRIIGRYIARIATQELLNDIARFISRHTIEERNAAEFLPFEAHLRKTHGTIAEPIALHGSVSIRRHGTYIACAVHLEGYAPAYKALETGEYALPEDRARALLASLSEPDTITDVGT